MQYNPYGAKSGDEEVALLQWMQDIFKDAWKLAQAKHLYPILLKIATLSSTNFNTLKDELGISAQSLTNRLKQLQDLNFIARQVSVSPPLTVRYELSEFGTNYCLLSLPFFYFFAVKPFWEDICEEFKETPPDLPMVECGVFPELKSRMDLLQKTKTAENRSAESNGIGNGIKSNILLSPYRDKALILISTALQMSKGILTRYSPTTKGSAIKDWIREKITTAMSVIQGKFFFDITYTLYICGRLSFNDIKRILPNINSLTLSTRLKELEQAEILTREVQSSSPLRVSYSLTKFGIGLICMFWPLISFRKLYFTDV